MDLQDRKVALRRSARDARRSLSPATRTAATAAIGERLGELLELTSAGTVLVYAAGATEVDVEAAAGDLRVRGVTTLYPRVRGEDLDLVAVDDPSALVLGHRDILEPTGPSNDPTTVDAVLVPGVAFDLHGGRLGQGGGHYDRLLPRIGDAVRIGIAFSCQIVPSVPRLDHDVAVDIVVTEQSVQRITDPDRA
ncbi:MAG: 5-formyltetrahydrofolate cyclo-ligase [Intrasporangiaceae bacterium]|nr:5-formyltetrahydrofolate cyclo-ligase [Intrasporangiaceae bacterium]